MHPRLRSTRFSRRQKDQAYLAQIRKRRFLLLALALVSASSCERPLPEPKVELRDAVIKDKSLSAETAELSFVLNTNNEPTKLVAITTLNGSQVRLLSRGRQMSMDGLVFGPTNPLIFKGDQVALISSFDAKGKNLAQIVFHLEPMGPLKAQVRVDPPLLTAATRK